MSRGSHAATRERPPTMGRGRHARPEPDLADTPARVSAAPVAPVGRAGRDAPVGPAGRDAPAGPAGPVAPLASVAPLAPLAPEPPATVAAPEILATARGASRRTAVIAGLVALVAVLAGGGVYSVVGRDSGGSAAGAAAGAQTTLLVQLRADDGTAAASALYATGGGGAAVLIPSRLVATVPGAGQQTLAGVLALHGGPALLRSTVSDLLGVRVDTQWVLDRAGLAALVNAVGGVTVDVPADVVSGSIVVVPAGRGQHLDGARAAALLLDRPAGEDDVQYQPRVQGVLAGVLGRLPSRARLATLLSRLPASGRPADTAAVTRVLAMLAPLSAKKTVLYQTLPVAALDADGVATYRPEVEAIDALVRGRLAGAALPGRGEAGNRVLVVNAVGTPGLGEIVRNRIVPAGFAFVGSRNQTPFGRAKTVVVVFGSDPATLARARGLAAAIGLPSAAIEVSRQGQSIADLMVVVGRDFRP